MLPSTPTQQLSNKALINCYDSANTSNFMPPKAKGSWITLLLVLRFCAMLQSLNIMYANPIIESKLIFEISLRTLKKSGVEVCRLASSCANKHTAIIHQLSHAYTYIHITHTIYTDLWSLASAQLATCPACGIYD